MPLTAKYSKKVRKAIKDASEARAKEKRAAASEACAQEMSAAPDAKNFEQLYKKVCEAFELMSISPAPVLQSSCNHDKSFIPARNLLGGRKPTDPAAIRWDPAYESTYTSYDKDSNKVYRT